jgi:hypothetical protein
MLLIGAKVSAQSAGSESSLSFGVKAAAVLSELYGDGAKDLDGKFGFGAGLFVEYTLENNVYFLSGLELVSKGAKVKDEGYKITLSPLYLQLPVHAGYKIGLSEYLDLGLHAGPYLAYGIGGKMKYEYDGKSEKEDFFGSEEEGGCKSFDLGLGIGADLILSKSFRLGLNYDLGLTNISRDKDNAVKNRHFSISVGYSF